MPDIPWPVDLVNTDTGATWRVQSMRELNEIRYSGRWRLKRKVPGLAMAVAEPTRAEAPREVTTRRGDPPDVSEPDAESVPEPAARPSRTRKTGRKG